MSTTPVMLLTLEKVKDYTMSTGSAFAVFPKLRKDNYFTWSADMKAMLESLNQWKIVTGELTVQVVTAGSVPTQEQVDMEEAWVLRKKRAYSEIMLRVEDEPQVLIMSSDDPREAWEKLKLSYGTKMANNRATLSSELVWTLRHDGTDTVFTSLPKWHVSSIMHQVDQGLPLELALNVQQKPCNSVKMLVRGDTG